MPEQNEWLEELAEVLADELGLEGWKSEDEKQSYIGAVKRLLITVRKNYPIMYREEAEFVGWLLDRGWIPPEEAKHST